MPLLPPTLMGVRVADDATIGALRVSAGGAGFVLGADRDGNRIVVQMFGPEPVDYALVSGLALRQLIAFRALALGALVLVQTRRPETWASFIRVAGGVRGDLRWYEKVEQVPPGRPNRPVLLLIDSESSFGGNVATAGAWSAVVSATDHATQWNVDDLTRVDVVFAESLSIASARIIGSAFGLPDNGVQLAGLDKDEVSLVSRGFATPICIERTPTEQWLTSARNPNADSFADS